MTSIAVDLRLTYRFYEWETKALPRIIKAAEDGHRIVLIGHSAGGAAALKVAWSLRDQGIPVEILIELDTYAGNSAPNKVLRDFREAPENVLNGLNYYQNSLVGYSGRPQTWQGEDIFTDGQFGNVLLDVGHSEVDDWVAKDESAFLAVKNACAPIDEDKTNEAESGLESDEPVITYPPAIPANQISSPPTIIGPTAFIDWVERALSKLETEAPDWYEFVNYYIGTIEWLLDEDFEKVQHVHLFGPGKNLVHLIKGCHVDGGVWYLDFNNPTVVPAGCSGILENDGIIMATVLVHEATHPYIKETFRDPGLMDLFDGGEEESYVQEQQRLVREILDPGYSDFLLALSTTEDRSAEFCTIYSKWINC